MPPPKEESLEAENVRTKDELLRCIRKKIPFHTVPGSDVVMMTELVVINFGNTQLGPEGGRALAGALKYLPDLKKLEILHCNLGHLGIQFIAGALKDIPNLLELRLTGNNLGPDGGRALAGALNDLPRLIGLSLGQNNLGPLGGRALAGALKNMPWMEKLDFIENNLGYEGGRDLADALKGLPKIAELYLWSNNLGAEGGYALAGALKELHGLEKLSLGNNNLGPDGIRHITQAIQHPLLSRLDISRNCISQVGGRYMAMALPKAPQLSHLRLSDFSIGIEVDSLIAQSACSSCPSLVELDLYSRGITAPTYQLPFLRAFRGPTPYNPLSIDAVRPLQAFYRAYAFARIVDGTRCFPNELLVVINVMTNRIPSRAAIFQAQYEDEIRFRSSELKKWL